MDTDEHGSFLIARQGDLFECGGSLEGAKVNGTRERPELTPKIDGRQWLGNRYRYVICKNELAPDQICGQHVCVRSPLQLADSN